MTTRSGCVSYIKSHARDVEAEWDIKAVERRVKAKLPKSYVDFVSTVGPTSFENVDEQEGFTASIRTSDRACTGGKGPREPPNRPLHRLDDERCLQIDVRNGRWDVHTTAI